MKTWKVNIMMVVAVFLALSGCSTVSVQQLSETHERPVLSAADAKSMIHIEVTALEPISVNDTVMAATD